MISTYNPDFTAAVPAQTQPKSLAEALASIPDSEIQSLDAPHGKDEADSSDEDEEDRSSAASSTHSNNNSNSRSTKKALLTFAANAGDYRAAEKLYHDNTDNAEKLYWAEIGAEHGSDLLKRNLGYTYLVGRNSPVLLIRDVSKNLTEAFRWYQKITHKDGTFLTALGTIMEESYRLGHLMEQAYQEKNEAAKNIFLEKAYMLDADFRTRHTEEKDKEQKKKILKEHMDQNYGLFSCCCRELQSLIPEHLLILDDQQNLVAYKAFLQKLLKLYESNPQDPRLIYHTAILLTASPWNSSWEHLIYPKIQEIEILFNQLVKRALADKEPLFFSLLTEDDLERLYFVSKSFYYEGEHSHRYRLLEPNLLIPVLQRYVKELEKARQQKRSILSHFNENAHTPVPVSDLILDYTQEQDTSQKKRLPLEEQQVKAFIKIYKALHEGHSYFFARIPSLEHVPLNNAHFIIKILAEKKTSYSAKAWELTKKYFDFETNQANYKALFKEIYQFKFDHSGLGIFKRSQSAGLTFYRSASLRKHLETNELFTTKKTLKKKLDDEQDTQKYERTRTIYKALNMQPG